MNSALSKNEAAILKGCEATIAKGKQTFVEVGMALCQIRDDRLYRVEFGSFNEYCEARWGWSDNYARRLISAAEVVKTVPIGTVSTESQARELAKVPADKRAKVLEKAGENPTAAEIKAAAIEVLPPEPPKPTKDAEFVAALGGIKAVEAGVTAYYERLELLAKEAFECATDKQLVSMSVYAALLPKLIRAEIEKRKRK